MCAVHNLWWENARIYVALVMIVGKVNIVWHAEREKEKERE